MQHEETDVKTNKHSVLGCLIAAVCRNGPSHGQGGSRRHLRWPNWLLPRPNGLLIPPDRGSSPLFRVCPAGSWEQLWFPRVLINPAPPCISYNKQSKLNRLVYEDSRQLGCPVLLSSSMSPNNRKKHSYLASLDSCPCFSQQYQGVQSISAASSAWAKTYWKSIRRNILCVLD